MPSERVQHQINELLDEAEAAIKRSEWETVQVRANDVLALDSENADAITYLAAAERRLATAPPAPQDPQPATQDSVLSVGSSA